MYINKIVVQRNFSSVTQLSSFYWTKTRSGDLRSNSCPYDPLLTKGDSCTIQCNFGWTVVVGTKDPRDNVVL